MLGTPHPIIDGRVEIRCGDEILVSKHNAIHFENMSIALAKSLAQRQQGHIYIMAFGNGGSTASGIGTITYKPPNVAGADSGLYQETYAKAATEDQLEIRHTPGDLYTDLVVKITLGYGEPSGQRAFDDATSADDTFVFDELCLKSFEGLLLTHVIFHPVQKSLNRAIDITYTLRLAMC